MEGLQGQTWFHILSLLLHHLRAEGSYLLGFHIVHRAGCIRLYHSAIQTSICGARVHQTDTLASEWYPHYCLLGPGHGCLLCSRLSQEVPPAPEAWMQAALGD